MRFYLYLSKTLVAKIFSKLIFVNVHLVSDRMGLLGISGFHLSSPELIPGTGMSMKNVEIAVLTWVYKEKMHISPARVEYNFLETF